MITTTRTKPIAVTVPVKALREGITATKFAVATRSSLPILTHTRIDVTSGAVSVMATDLELWAKHTLPGMVMDDDAAAAVPSRNFTELLASMSADTITLAGDEDTNAVQIKAGKSSYKLLGLSAAEFPLLPDIGGEKVVFTIEPGNLKRLLSRTLFASSHDETRVILTGLLWIVEGATLKSVATDTHRLAVASESVERLAAGNGSVVIPARALTELSKIVDKASEPVRVTLASGHIEFYVPREHGAKTTLISRLIDGQFPNYERVIPGSPTRTLTLRREEFGGANRRAAIVARENNNRVVLSLTDTEKLSLTAESRNVGQASEDVECFTEGESSQFQIAFSSKYIDDAIGALESEGFLLELTEPLRPGLVRPVGDESYLCVLMPMQVV